MARVKFNVRSLDEMVRLSYIDSQECRSLNSAYDFILRVRTELHYQSNCANDVLYLKFQPPVARELGWSDPSRLRATEDFMRSYFQHARNMAQITEEIGERLAFRQLRLDSKRTILSSLLRASIRGKEVVDGFRIQDGTLFPHSETIFNDDPLRLLRVFRLAQQKRVSLSPELRQLIRNHLALIDRSFQRNRRAADVFLSILGQRGYVAEALRMMHQTGVLGRYLPEFRGLDCLVQFEFYHRFTADEHTLKAIEVLDALFHQAPEGHPIHGRMRSMLLDFSRPWLLYLALLYHDTGRGTRAKDHAVASRKLVERATKRLRMPPQDRKIVITLVQHHILMARISQLRDLSDPQTIGDFVQLVPTETMLKMLLLLTYSDTVGTGADLWNDWRASLLWELYHKADSTLSGKTGELLAGAQIEEIRPALVGKPPKGVSVEQVETHLARFPWRYFETIEPKMLRLHLQMAAALEAGRPGPIVRSTVREELGFTEIVVGIGDRPGLFSLISGSLAAAGMNILGARIFTRSDGLALDVFNVTQLSGHPEIGKDVILRFTKILKRALKGEVDLADMAVEFSTPKIRSLELAEMIHRPEIWVNNEASLDRTVVEVRAEDRPGLLFMITDCIANRGFDIDFSKISTQGRMVVDSFYIRGADGAKVPREDLDSLAESLSRTLHHWLGGSGQTSTNDRKQVKEHV
jgi:[protein-PII] uridylyltransferase